MQYVSKRDVSLVGSMFLSSLSHDVVGELPGQDDRNHEQVFSQLLDEETVIPSERGNQGVATYWVDVSEAEAEQALQSVRATTLAIGKRYPDLAMPSAWYGMALSYADRAAEGISLIGAALKKSSNPLNDVILARRCDGDQGRSSRRIGNTLYPRQIDTTFLQ